MNNRWYKKLVSLSPRAILLWFEALFLLAIARLLVWLLPFKYWSGLLGEHMSANQAYQQQNIKDKTLLEITWAIKSAAYRAPWQAVCLPQAVAAKWMLGFRSQPSKLYLGVKSDNDALGKLAAHAWLVCGQQSVTGGTADEFTSVSYFI